MLLLLALACRPDCPEGQSFNASRECVDTPSGSESVEGAENLPDCEPLDPGTRLDVVYGCADDVCARDSYDTFLEILGEPIECSDYDEALFCYWLDEGLWASFDDADFDEVPDEGTEAQILHVQTPWDGADADGLGVGVSGTCFLDHFGYTEDVDYDEVTEGELQIDYIWWDSVSAAVYLDDEGVVEQISMFGIH